MRLQATDPDLNRRTKKTSLCSATRVMGVLLPSNSDNVSSGDFSLSVGSQIYSLQVPQSLRSYLRKHLWETFEVWAIPARDRSLKVKKVKIREDMADESMDFDRQEDVQLYQHLIHQGLTLGSIDDEA